MLIDLAEHGTDRPLRLAADVCIVGAGVAGLAVARRLLAARRSVILLESGGGDYEPEIAALNAGIGSGMPYYDLEDARLRFFGGTAAIWGGRCAELDDIDFEPREWVRYSGWPFGKAALAGYYAEARTLLRLGRRRPDEQLWRAFGVAPPQFGKGVVSVDFWQFDDHWDRFGLAANRELLTHPGLTVVLHATATNLAVNVSGSAVERIDIAALNGARGSVQAERFVLAAGGLENPRLLLASRSRHPDGVGNDHDVVGRYFMEHPHARGGRLHVDRLWQALRSFRSSHWADGGRYAACLRADDRLQQRCGILNTSFAPRVRPHPDDRLDVASRIYKSIKDKAAPTRQTRLAWRMARSLSRHLKRSTDPLQSWLAVRGNARGLYLSVRAEQAPNPDSRVRLIEARDALGMPRIALDWRLGEIDKRSVAVLMAELDAQMRREHSGRVDAAAWLSQDDVSWEHDALISMHPIGGYHHMGTTRMATNPRFGVVDANCRVHGVANLYIAGSSVFPTSGWANPTLTILALSLRLGDHLARLMSGAETVTPLAAA